MQLKKHSYEFLGDGKLKVWVTVEESPQEQKATQIKGADKQKIGDFTIIVDDSISREELDKAIKAEFEKRKKQLERVKELGIGEAVK